MRRSELAALGLAALLHAPLLLGATASSGESARANASPSSTIAPLRRLAPIAVAAPRLLAPRLASPVSPAPRAAARPSSRAALPATSRRLASPAGRPDASASPASRRALGDVPALGVRLDLVASPGAGAGALVGVESASGPDPASPGRSAASDAGAPGTRPIEASQADVPPRRVPGAEPLYPALEARAGHEGAAVLRLLVRADGSVASATVLEVRGAPAFGEAAREAALGWRFEPAQQAGRAVDCLCTQRLAFTLGRSR